ncbi:hypothetical protein MRX96_032912 [Rhipicephalus microplus]
MPGPDQEFAGDIVFMRDVIRLRASTERGRQAGKIRQRLCVLLRQRERPDAGQECGEGNDWISTTKEVTSIRAPLTVSGTGRLRLSQREFLLHCESSEPVRREWSYIGGERRRDAARIRGGLFNKLADYYEREEVG